MTGNYFSDREMRAHSFIPSGCETLDCALGGGYVLGRIAVLVGDRSTGKTLLAVEAVTNFCRVYPEGLAWYTETEAAFDRNYAAQLGMPVHRVTFHPEHAPCRTIEQLYQSLKEALATCEKTDKPGIYVLDSLDALSDEAELKRELGDAAMGTAKPKLISEAWRRLCKDIEDSRLAVLIVSQIRDKIGVVFGRKWTRSGGKAMDFYATHIIDLANKGKIEVTRGKVKRAIGVEVEAYVEKNKVALPFRTARFPVLFGFGVDDLTANLEWLRETGALDDFLADHPDVAPAIKATLKAPLDVAQETYQQLSPVVARAVRKHWQDVEQRFLPARSKYAAAEPATPAEEAPKPRKRSRPRPSLE